jgi:hypothetical protein
VVAALVALLGGTALTALLAARRTESSFPRFLASTNPSALLVQPSTQLSEAEAKAFLAQIAGLLSFPRFSGRVGCVDHAAAWAAV